MKQNKHQLEHLPTLLVQQIRLQWYKDCRGAYSLCIYHTEARWISDR